MKARIAAALAVAAFGAAGLTAESAHANNGGLPGYTRKPTAIAPQGESCNQCHTGGTAPTVAINGPASLAAGQSAEYTLVVTTGAARAGGGVAGSDGVVLTAGTGFRDSFGEMVQNAPLAPTGGAATFRFTVKAPATGNTLKLWAVGLAANNSASQAGDSAAHTTRDIAITGGATPPAPDAGTPGGGGGMDAGTGSGAEAGAENAAPGSTTSTSTSTGTSDGEDNGIEPDGDEDEDGNAASYGPGRGRALGGPAGAACASVPLAIDREGFAAAASVVLMGTMIARRRKRA